MADHSKEAQYGLLVDQDEEDAEDGGGGGGGGGAKLRLHQIHSNQSFFRFQPKVNFTYVIIFLVLFFILLESYLLTDKRFVDNNGDDRTHVEPNHHPKPLVVHDEYRYKATDQPSPNELVDIILNGTLPRRYPLPLIPTLNLIESQSNLPALYWNDWKNGHQSWTGETKSMNGVCHRIQMIPIHQLKQMNRFWQTLQSPIKLANGSDVNRPFMINIYNAYYDDRPVQGGPMVRLITACDEQVLIEHLSLGCLLWFDKVPSPVASNVTEIYTMWPEYWDFGVKSGIYGPQLITCSIPESFRDRIPRAVSLTEKPGCEVKLENIVRIIHNVNRSDLVHQPDNRIGVCVHAFRYRTYDFSVRLVEWLEMVRLMGGAKIYFYVYDATDSVYQVLRHYAAEGLVDWRKITFPGWQPNIEGMYQYYYEQLNGLFWPQELLEMNDCLYRNYKRHTYIALFDVDEMLMPRQKLDNWFQVIESVESKMTEQDFQTKSYYLNRHAYVYEKYEENDDDTIPSYLHMMRHTYRAKPYEDGTNIKCFHRSQMVTALHTHFPLRCLNQNGHHNCQGIDMDPVDQSMLMHYRPNRDPDPKCVQNKSLEQIKNQCTVHDRTAWKWYHRLEPVVRNKLQQIFL